MKGKTKKRIAIVCSVGVLIAFSTLAGVTAYLTDNESHTNKFTVGDVKIDLEEPTWSQTDANNNNIPDAAEKLVGNQTVAKDPVVENTGLNDAIVFLRVTVPVKDVTMVTDTGLIVTSLNTDGSAKTNLARTDNTLTSTSHFPQDTFYFKSKTDAPGVHVNHFNTNENYRTGSDNTALNVRSGEYWVQLTGGTTAEPIEFNQNVRTQVGSGGQTEGQRVYVFGYNKTVAPGTKTEPLFDVVQLKNFIEGEIANTTALDIKIEAFAIQADDIIGSDQQYANLNSTAEANKKTLLTTIYNNFVNQNGTFDPSGNMVWNKNQSDTHGQGEKEANTNNSKNLAGGNRT